MWRGNLLYHGRQVATVLLSSIAIGCSNQLPAASTSGVAAETSVARPACASNEVAVAVTFVAAVQAHDVNAYSACESAATQPAADLVTQLAEFGTLVLDRASLRDGRSSVDIPSPPIPNGDPTLVPHQCGVIVLGAFEAGGWFVTGIHFYCS